MMPIRELMAASPVMPVIVLDRVADAVPLARALVNGGIRVLEITLRTPVALDCVRAIRAAVPEAIVGAGTLTRPEDFLQVAEAGGQFAVTPGLTDELVAAAKRAPFPLLPGVATASELLTARAAGYTALKFFPAEPAGGTAMLSAFAPVFPNVIFCPTGGITRASAPRYLALKNVACVGGSWVTPAAALGCGDWTQIEALARDAAGLAPAG